MHHLLIYQEPLICRRRQPTALRPVSVVVVDSATWLALEHDQTRVLRQADRDSWS
jgi:hypothetical protein